MNIKGMVLGLLSVVLFLTNKSRAQEIAYLEMYPNIPFNVVKASELGFIKSSSWLNINRRTSGDKTGTFWSESIKSYNSKNYEYFEGDMQMMYEYNEKNQRIRSEEYFYKDSLLTAVERLSYDSVGNRRVQNAFIYLYYDDGTLFHRVTEFGPPNHKIRLVDQFKIDTLGQVMNQRMTVSGDGPHIDSITGGLTHGDKRLIVRELTDSTERIVVFKNLYSIKEEYRSVLNKDGSLKFKEKLNADGSVMYRILFTYSDAGYCQSKRFLDDKDHLFQIEYFNYNEEGLLETHITERGERQIYIEYSYYAN